MRFLVTGTTGFAAPHLIKKLLDNGHDVTGMVRDIKKGLDISDIVGTKTSNVKFVLGDLTELDTITDIFKNNTFDGVFHLGAFAHPPSSFVTPALSVKTNVLGTARICDEITDKMPNCVLMNCSTPEVYGICPENSSIDEMTPYNPMNPYGVSKAGADMYVSERMRNNNLKGFITRAFSHTGPRRGKNFSISSDAIQVAKIIKKQQEPIIKVGNLDCKRKVADVRDITDVYYRLMIKSINGEIPNGEIYHISADDLHDMRYFLNLMLKLFNVNATTEIDPNLYRKIDIPIQIPDDSKVRKLLNWKPTIPIEKTLEDLVTYWINKL